MTVKIVECDRFEAAPLVQNQQFFTTVAGGEPQVTFMVNHNYWQTASGFLAANQDHIANENEWDYVRSATIPEVEQFIYDNEEKS